MEHLLISGREYIYIKNIKKVLFLMTCLSPNQSVNQPVGWSVGQSVNQY